jgi:Arc/MetJ family transcription regulator
MPELFWQDSNYAYFGSMKTTIDIPERSLREAMKHTGAKTKRAAVVTAVDEFNRRRRLAALAERLHGSCPDFMTRKDLQRMRKDRRWEPPR